MTESMDTRSFNSEEARMPPTEPPSLPPLPWKEGIELVLARYEHRILEHAMAQAGGVKRRAATLLGISRYALERRLTRVARTLQEAAGAQGTPNAEPERASTTMAGEG